jgi:hypothetical protein
MAKGKTKLPDIKFTPYPGYIVLELPKEAYPSIIVHNEKQWKSLIEETAQKYVNGELKVVKLGDGIEFVKPGDRICLASHARVQSIETENDGVGINVPENAKYPKIWWVIREADILVKFD